MRKQLMLIACLTAVSSGVASASVIMDWDASNWSGSGSWTDSVGGIVAVQGGFSDGGPVKETTTLGGQTVDTIHFTSDSFDVNIDGGQPSTPLADLKEFSISLLFSVSSAGSAGPTNEFWNWNGFVGKERGGHRAGDWVLGIASGGVVGGATGIADGAFGNNGDLGTLSGSSYVGTGFHTMTLVVDNNDDGTFSQYLYLDGALANSDLNVTYGGEADIANDNFAIGARRDGGFGYLEDGSIARLIFDDSALSQGDVTTLHASYLGEAIPEPGAALLVALGGLGMFSRRRR